MLKPLKFMANRRRMVSLGAGIALAATGIGGAASAATDTAAHSCIGMGGKGSLFTLTAKSGIGALSGAINGAAYGEPTSDMTDVGNGTYEYTMSHVFLDRDGSRLRTQDHASLKIPTGGGDSTLDVRYTVVEATGRFAGYGGTFHGHGELGMPDANQNSVGDISFTGRLCRGI